MNNTNSDILNINWKIPVDIKAKFAKNGNSAKIITRFSPEPSGYLHIGHAKAIYFNYYLAKRAGGKFIIRIDDTNPLKESLEFEQAIIFDISSMGIVADLFSYSSDYYKQIVDITVGLINKGLVYYDSRSKEAIRLERVSYGSTIVLGTISNILYNLECWEMFIDNHLDGVFRIRLDMCSKNGAMRDPIVFRKCEKVHPRTGFFVNPTYDYVCPLVDYLEEVSHVVRSTEFEDRNEQYRAILQCIGVKIPELITYGKLNFDGINLSKREIKKLISTNLVSGWDDPRLYTIAGLFRRGLSIDALKIYISEHGLSKKCPKESTTKLWAINEKKIDLLSVRYKVIKTDHLIVACITNYDKYANVSPAEWPNCLPKYKKNPQLGQRPSIFSSNILINREDLAPYFVYDNVADKNNKSLIPHDNRVIGQEITLIDIGNFIITNCQHSTKLLELIIDLEYVPNGDFKSTECKVRWVDNETRIDVSLIEIGDIGSDAYTKEVLYVGENSMTDLELDGYVQLVKMKGYYKCCDVDKIGRRVTLSKI